MYPRAIVVMPVRDDWPSASELVRRLDRTLSGIPYSIRILMIDDGSAQTWETSAFQFPFSVIESIQILKLRRNLGHQRAIAIGLTYVEHSLPCDAVLVMDADGEDTPEGAKAILLAFSSAGGEKAIFAERTRRSESRTFRGSYRLYRTAHFLLTGVKVRVGNFSVLPRKYLHTLVVLSELWNHYAAAIFHSRLPYRLVPIPRGRRIAGTSRMNWVSTVTHGLGAIAVYGDVVGVRVLIGSIAGCFLIAGGIAGAVLTKLFSDWSFPDWATAATGTLLIILMQLVTIAASFTFFMLSNRTNVGFVPLRDYQLFISECVDVFRREPE